MGWKNHTDAKDQNEIGTPIIIHGLVLALRTGLSIIGISIDGLVFIKTVQRSIIQDPYAPEHVVVYPI